MSKVGLYAVYDVKADAYSPPMVFNTKGLAIRFLETEMKRSDSSIAAYPADYTLVQLGEFDLSTGSVTGLTAPIPVIKALDFGGKNG